MSSGSDGDRTACGSVSAAPATAVTPLAGVGVRAGGVGAGGADELARLKRQVAALKATAPPVIRKENPPPKKKNTAIFSYWKETSAADGRAAPPAMRTPTTTPVTTTHGSGNGAARKKYGQPSPAPSHHFTPTTSFAALPTLPLGRPPHRKGADFRPSGAQYDHDDDPASASASSSGGDKQGPQRKGGHGERWSPSSEIRKGSVTKFTQMFGTDHSVDERSLSPVRSKSPPKARRGTWDPPKLRGSPQGSQQGEVWSPKEEIDTTRIDSIKAMWGAKTGGANNKLVIAPLPFRRASVAKRPSAAAAKNEGSGHGDDDHDKNNCEASQTSDVKIKPQASMETEKTTVDVVTDDDDEPSGQMMGDDETDVGGDEMDVSWIPDEDGSVITNDPPSDGASPLSAGHDGESSDDGENEEGAEETSEEPPSLEDKLAMWEEIMGLVAEVLPDEVDRVDDLLAQFNGRESKLRDALRGMKERDISIKSGDAHDGEGCQGTDEEMDEGGDAAAVAFPGGSVAEDGSITTLTSDLTGKGAAMQFQDMGQNVQYANMNRIVSDALIAKGSRATVSSSKSSSASPDEFLSDDDEEANTGNAGNMMPSEREVDGRPPRPGQSAAMGFWAQKEREMTAAGTPGTSPDNSARSSQNSRRFGKGSDGIVRSLQNSVPVTPPTSNIRSRGPPAGVIAPIPFRVNDVDSPEEDHHTALRSLGTLDSHGVHSGSMEDGTIESEESKHVSFMDVSGLALHPGLLEEVEPWGGDAAHRAAKDKFAEHSYRYSSSDSGTSDTHTQPPEKQISSSSDDTARTDNRDVGPMAGDMEEGRRRKGLPLVNALDALATNAAREPASSHRFFETFEVGSAVPSIDVPTTVGLLKNGRAPSVVSPTPEPRTAPLERRRPMPWYKRRRTKGFACVALLLLAACGAILGLFFSGALLGGDGDESENELPLSPDLPVAAKVGGSVAPSWRPSSSPSASPSATPTTTCTVLIRSQDSRLGLGKDPGDQAPKVAVDGTNAVVATNSGRVLFYSLVNRRWVKVDEFPNVNGYSLTPAVAISGDVAVVGIVYQVLGFNQGIGGAYVYERDHKSGRWKRAQVLAPDPDEGIDGEDKFGWSVDVDADQEEPLVVVGAHGENDKVGSVHVFRRTPSPRRTLSLRSAHWSRVGKVLPDFCPQGDFESNFGYSVAVSGNVIAASADCDFIVQLSTFNGTLNGIESFQNVRYIDFKLGAIGSLVMNEMHLAYSTFYGAVAVYERVAGGGGGGDGTFEFLEQLDFSKNEKIIQYPLAMDRDILAVGIGNEYWIFPKTNGAFNEGAFLIENREAGEFDVPSMAVGGRNVVAGSGDPHEVYHYDITSCAHGMPTLTPTLSSVPTPSPTWRPSRRPSASASPTREPTTEGPTMKPTTGRPTAPPTYSNAPTQEPTTSPSPRPTAPPTTGPVVSSSSPSFSPVKSPTLSPSVSPTKQVVETLPPSASPTKQAPEASCYSTEISILYDSTPFGVGYTLIKVEPSGAQSNVDTYFVPFSEDLANQRYIKSLCLDEGSYKFTMYDSYSNGICCANGNGEYAVTSDGATLAQGGEFGFSEVTLFELPAGLF